MPIKAQADQGAPGCLQTVDTPKITHANVVSLWRRGCGDTPFPVSLRMHRPAMTNWQPRINPSARWWTEVACLGCGIRQKLSCDSQTEESRIISSPCAGTAPQHDTEHCSRVFTWILLKSWNWVVNMFVLWPVLLWDLIHVKCRDSTHFRIDLCEMALPHAFKHYVFSCERNAAGLFYW